MCPLCAENAHILKISPPWLWWSTVFSLVRDSVISLVGLLTGYAWTAIGVKVVIALYEMWYEVKNFQIITQRRAEQFNQVVRGNRPFQNPSNIREVPFAQMESQP